MKTYLRQEFPLIQNSKKKSGGIHTYQVCRLQKVKIVFGSKWLEEPRDKFVSDILNMS